MLSSSKHTTPTRSTPFRTALARAPDWAYARHNLALTHIESGDYQAAEREYREAILRAPYHPYLYYNLGLLLQRLNRNRDAESEYRRSLEKFNEQMVRYHGRALRWARVGKEEESQLAFLRERILRKNQAEVHNALGSLWQGRGKNDRAERHYLAAAKLNPNLLPARYNLGLLYMHMASKKKGSGKLEDAIRLWEETLEKDAGYVPSRLKLAEAYRVQERFADADEQYREVLRLRPQYRAARWALDRNQADHLYAQGETAEACRKYRSVLDDTEHRAGPTLDRQLRRKLKQRCR